MTDPTKEAQDFWIESRYDELMQKEGKHYAALVRTAHEFAAQRVAEAVERTIERCALAAYSTKLPPDFQWGEEARDNFDFGKEQAGRAICALKEPRR